LKAVVYLGPKNVKVEDVSEPKPKKDEALVRFKAGSICGTDLHFYRGEWTGLALGRIIGHDASGQVEETGEQVAIVPKVSCGACQYCIHGQPGMCERGGFMGFERDGLFSELIAAPKRNLLPIPSNVSLEEAGILEPVSLALHTFDLLSPRVGWWATILGQGPIGLLMTQVAKTAGCRVIAIDPEDYRLKLSEEYGADICVNPRNENVTEKVRRLTHGGSDIVVEAAGRQETVEQTPLLARKAGKVALVGDFSGFLKLNEAEEAIFFSVIVDPLKYLLALDLLNRKVLDVKGLISHRFPLTQFESAMVTAADPSKRPVKVVLTS